MGIPEDATALLGKRSADKAIILTDTAATKQKELSPKSGIWKFAQSELDKIDPESEQNIGKWATTAELEARDPKALILNAAAGIKKWAATDFVGVMAEAIHGGYDSNQMAERVSQEGLDAYKKELSGEPLTPEDMEILDRNTYTLKDLGMYRGDPLPHLSMRDRIAKTFSKHEAGKLAAKQVDELMQGTEDYNPVLSDQLMARIQKVSQKHAPAVNEAIADVKEGKYLEGAIKGIPAMTKHFLGSLLEGVTNPAEASQLVATEIGDLMLAMAGPVGVTASAMESYSRYVNMTSDGIVDYINRTGKVPGDEGLLKIQLASGGAALLDQIGDVSGAGTGKLFKVATKGFAKKTGKVVGATLGAGAIEHATETAQTIIEEGPAKLKPIQDVTAALTAGGAGAIVGGGMAPSVAAGVTATQVAKGIGKVVAATGKATVEAFKPKTTEEKVMADKVKSPSKHGFKAKVKAAVEAKDVEQYKESDPILAVNALQEMNQAEDITPAEENSNYNEAQDIVNNLNTRQEEILDELGKDTEVDKKLNKEFDSLTKIRSQIAPLIKAMGKIGPTTPELKAKLTEAKDALGIKEAVTELLGSKSIGLDTDLTVVAESPDIDPETKQLVDDLQTLTESKEALKQHITPIAGEKTTQIVSENIFEGSGNQKGINNFISAIQNGDTETQKKELAGLKEFADRKQERASDFRAALDGTAELPKGKYKQRSGKPAFVSKGMEKIVIAMELEAKALADAVILGSRIANIEIPPTRKGVITEPVVETKGLKAKPAAPSAPTSKPSAAISDPGVVTPGAVDTSIKVPSKFVQTEAKVFFQKAKDFVGNLIRNVQKAGKKIDPEQKQVYRDIISFDKAFAESNKQTYKHEFEKFKDLYPLTQLAEHLENVDGKAAGVLPDKVVQAMAAISYKWLATRGQETILNTKEDIQGLFGLNDEDLIIREAHILLGDKGTPNGILAEDLGKDILKLIGLKVTTEAQAQEQERMEIALGLAALANMEKMGLVKRNTISRTQFETLKTANSKLKFDFKLEGDFLAKTGVEHEAGITYFVIHSVEGELVGDNLRIKTNYDKSKKTWDTLFSDGKDRSEYSWNIFVPEDSEAKEPLRKSNQTATQKQTSNKVKNERRPVNLASRTMNIWSFLGEENQKLIAGQKDENTAHAERKIAVKSTNLQIGRGIEQLNSWLIDSLNHGGYETDFYIPAYFISGGRMYQEGSINLQASKIHRYLFSMADWNTKVDSPELEAKFMEAVGQSLGIEASKFDTLADAKVAWETKLSSDVVKDALKAIDEVLAETDNQDKFKPESAKITADMKPQLMQPIVDGVLAGGESVHTFKGLIEYQRYLISKRDNTEFTTDLTLEIDGKANGPIIASLQLTVSKLTPEQLGIYMSGGLAFTSEVGEADHNITHDPYQAIGAVWGNELAKLENAIVKEDIGEYKRLRAAKRLVGDLFDKDGVIESTTRKLAKNRSVGALYGSGAKKIVLGLLKDVFIETAIYDQLQNIAADPDNAQELYKSLVQDVNIMAGTKNFGVKGKVDAEAILGTKIPENVAEGLQDNIEEYHGRALNRGIKAIYGDIQMARKPLNTAITIAVAHYNAAHELLVNEHMKTHDDITVGQLQAIRKKLQPLFPKVKTPMGGYIELAEFDRSKDYDLDSKLKVEQKYKGGISLQKGRPHNIGVLKNPGVKPVVTMIHMLDSMIANQIIGNKDRIGVLNVHDGFVIGLEQSTRTSDIANESFYVDMQKYSVAEAVITGRLETLTAFSKLIPKGADRDAAIKKAYADLELTNDFQATPQEANDKNNSETKAVRDGGTLTTYEDGKEVRHNLVGTEANKKEVLDAVTHANQYHSAGGGYDTKKDPKQVIGGVLVDSIIPLASKGVANLSKQNRELVTDTKLTTESIQKELGSKAGDRVSTDPDDYATKKELNGNNVIETYDIIKNDSESTVPADDPDHDRTLKGLLISLVQQVMDPVDLFLKTNPEEETHGVLKTGEGRQELFLSSQVSQIGPVSGALTTGIRMSTGETYVHELIHAVTHSALNLKTFAGRKLQTQVETIYDIARTNLDYKAFLNDPTIDVKDLANKFEVEAAEARFDYIFRGGSIESRTYIDPVTKVEHTETKSSHLDEFIALGLSNKNFATALRGVDTRRYRQKILAKSTWEGIMGDNIQEAVVNIGQKVMELIHEAFVTADPATNVEAELKRLTNLLVHVDSKNKTMIYDRVSSVSAAFDKVADKGDQYIKQIFQSAPVLKTIINAKKGFDVALESDTAMGDLLRSIEYKYTKLDYGLIKSIITEARGHTERMDALHKLLLRRKVFLDDSKSTAIAKTKDVAISAFTKIELTVTDKITLTKIGLKTDLAYLLGQMDVYELHNYVASTTALQQKIDRVLKDLKTDKDLAPHSTFYQRSSDALGHMMITGRLRSNEDVTLSSKGIAALKGIKQEGSLTDAQIDRANDYVNQLASLYALQHTSKKQRLEFAAIMEKDPEGVAIFLRLHNELKADSLEKAFGGNEYQMIKGYTKEILNSRIEYKLGTKEDQAEFERQGYIMSRKPVPRDTGYDPMSHIEMYAFTADTGRVNDFLSMIFSLTSNRAKGSDSYRLAQQMDLSTKVGAQNNKKILAGKRALRNSMYLPGTATYKKNVNPMIAIVDPDGNTTNYRYMMAEATKDDYLEKLNEFDTIMGAMAGQTIDKARTPIINTELVHVLKAMYDEEYENNPSAYIEIGPHSEDPVLREKYYMLPAATRQAITSIWGGDTMFVAKDVLTIAFGYRQYSIVEAFAKTPEQRHWMEKIVVGLANGIFRQYGLQVANTLELVMQALTKLAKNNIVVKTLYVTLENFGSNLHYLRTKGMSVDDILKFGWEAFSQGLVYQADKKALDKLELQIKVMKPSKVKEAEYKIIRLKDKITRNPVSKAIKSGLLPSIVDDVETDVTQDNFPSPAEKYVKKQIDKLPEVVQTVGKVLVLAQDTPAYKVLNNAVKMTDFVGRYALLQHKMAEGQNYDDSVIEVMEEFINFDLPTHKSIEYLNKTGIVWFSKYAIRIQKVILNSTIDKPFRALSTMLLATQFGMDTIGNSLIGVTKDLTNNLGNPFEMMLESIDKILPVSVIKSLFGK